MSVLNLGSLNIDSVFRVVHIARPGETIASRSVAVCAGGKGANQSVALARAGARVVHFGRVGTDGSWLLEKLAREGVDTRGVRVGPGPTGQAIIQVDDDGQNAIVLSPGANHEITPRDVDAALDGCPRGTWLLVQNETSSVGEAIERAKRRGMRVAFNPAPIDERVRHYPLELVDLLVVNIAEGAALAGQGRPQAIVGTLAEQWPLCEVVLTLGAEGVVRRGPDGEFHAAARKVNALDTTAAGDTFLGYYLASRIRGMRAEECLELACRAGALCVTRPGAMDSIPRWEEVQAFG
jgi:ribokinase